MKINYWIYLTSIEILNELTKTGTIYIIVNKLESFDSEFPIKIAREQAAKIMAEFISNGEIIRKYKDRFGVIQVDKCGYDSQKIMVKKLSTLENLREDGKFFLIVDYEKDIFKETRGRFCNILSKFITFEPSLDFYPTEKRKLIVNAKLCPIGNCLFKNHFLQVAGEGYHPAVYTELQSFGFYYRIFKDGMVVAPGSTWVYFDRASDDIIMHNPKPCLSFVGRDVPYLTEYGGSAHTSGQYFLAVED